MNYTGMRLTLRRHVYTPGSRIEGNHPPGTTCMVLRDFTHDDLHYNVRRFRVRFKDGTVHGGLPPHWLVLPSALEVLAGAAE